MGVVVVIVTDGIDVGVITGVAVVTVGTCVGSKTGLCVVGKREGRVLVSGNADVIGVGCCCDGA